MNLAQNALPLALTSLLLAACTTTAPTEGSVLLVPVSQPINHLEGTAYEAALQVSLPVVAATENEGLHNVFSLGEWIISGGEPVGDEAFRQLSEMGVRTILSVDGKVPDAELAANYGISYVHVPIEYRGIPADSLRHIAKTFREKEGPFYVHCFHGKHRGPAAAAIGRLVLDGISREQALAEMRQWCGTSSNYEGLYKSVAESVIPSARETQADEWDFPAAHVFKGFRHGMIVLARASDNLKYLSKHDWQPTAEHPDIDAVNEATKLAAAFARCTETKQALGEEQEHQALMQEAVDASQSLRSLLQSEDSTGDRVERANVAFAAIQNACSSCHKLYRND